MIIKIRENVVIYPILSGRSKANAGVVFVVM